MFPDFGFSTFAFGLSTFDFQLQRHPLFHLLDNSIGRRANGHILEREVGNLLEFLTVGMGKFAAGFGPYVINHAVIFAIQKRTRNTLQHIIVVFVYAKVLFDKLLWFLPQMFGNPFDIGQRKERPGGLAAIGALQAVGPSEFGIVQFLHHIIQVFGRLLFQLIKILFVFDMLIFG